MDCRRLVVIASLVFLAAVLFALAIAGAGDEPVFDRLTARQAAPAKYDIVCLSGGVPILRVAGVEGGYDSNGVLRWSDGDVTYASSAECVIRTAKP